MWFICASNGQLIDNHLMVVSKVSKASISYVLLATLGPEVGLDLVPGCAR